MARIGCRSGQIGRYEVSKSVEISWENLILARILAFLGVITVEVLPNLHQYGEKWGLLAVILTPMARAAIEWLKDNRKQSA